jgi:tetratricopeptide (TPR) repeat protein
LGLVYIREENYEAAIQLLLSGLDKAQDDEVRYDVLKNLGWARLGQQRYAEAETYLNAALQITANNAPAHCHFAQVYEGQAKLKDAKNEWENCLRYASERNPDEDAWIALARGFLEGYTP